MTKIMFVFGTRPEFIKLYPVIREARTQNHEVVVVSTGQHREMLNDLFDELALMPDHDLGIMTREQSLAQILSRTVERLDAVVRTEQPELIIVHGDTSATLSGSLVSLYQQVPLAHVEAGLRTFNKYSPFPEEMNRQLTGVIADYHFTPTLTTHENLLREGKDPSTIHVVGNSAIDMLQYTVREDYSHPVLDSLGNRKLILMTVHRRENISVLAEMFAAINDIALRYGETHKILYPIHMNPAVRREADKYLTSPAIEVIEPLGTVDFHNIMARAHLILTDSGGIQEEAPSLGKPVLVLRDTTERPEGVAAGTLRLVGTTRDAIVRETCALLDNEAEYKAMAEINNPYGDGTTSRQIIDVINALKIGGRR